MSKRTGNRAEETETPLSLHIMDSEYRIACPPDERDALLTAAQHLNDTMQGIRNTGKVVGIERIAVMAALNISYELLGLQRQNAEQENAVGQRIAALLAQTSGALNRLRHDDRGFDQDHSRQPTTTITETEL